MQVGQAALVVAGLLVWFVAEPAAAGRVMRDAMAKGLVVSVDEGHRIPGIKRSVLVRLAEKVTPEQLEGMAEDIRADDSHYERIFIEYLLPGMKDGAGAWATTHFEPKLRVRILGMSLEAEAKLSTVDVVAGREVIGAWLHENLMLGSRVVLFKNEGRVFAETTFMDGSYMLDEYKQKTASNGATRFDRVDSDSSDYLLVLSDGGLEVRDRVGAIGSTKRLQ